MTRIAVTGATGFIGRRVVQAALDEGWDVLALVRKADNLPRVPRLTHAVWNAEAPAFDGELADVDKILHIAARVPANMADPREAAACLATNGGGTLALLTEAAARGAKRFIYFSTGNMYAPSESAVDEAAPLYPSHRAPYYLTSKLVGEVYADHFQKAGILSTASLRIASVYGPGMNAGSVIARFAQTLREGREITLNDGGVYGVDFVYVDDVVRVAIAAARSGDGGAFNVSGGQRTTLKQLAETIASLLNADPALIKIKPPGAKVDLGFAGLDIERARTRLQFSPTELSHGLREYLRSLGS